MPISWKPLLICPRADISQRITGALQEIGAPPAATLAEYPRMGAVAALARQNGCDICFLDVATNAEHAQQLIAELAPDVPVVALHHRADADLILRCLRRGACEFLTESTADALRPVFERLGRSRAPAPQAAGSIYCVVPGKAGCGGSTVAAHLAIALAVDSARVLLVDGDWLNGSIAFLLKLKPEFHLGDVLRDWGRMDQDLWGRLTVATHGVDVLGAPENPGAGAGMERERAAEVCAFWRERYDAAVIDLPDARAAGESGLAAVADTILLVSTNELAALQATRRAMEYLERPPASRARVRLLINRYTPSTGLKREDVKTALGIEPYAILANDYDALQAALLDGRPAPPGSRFRVSVEALARQLQNRGDGTRKSGLLAGLLRPRHKASSGK